MEITPTYHFTKDGEHPLKRSQDLLKGIKRLEGHEAVRGQVLMWAEFLRPRADLLRVEPYPYLGFYWLRAFEVDRGIPDAAWAARRSKEKEPEEEAVVTTEHVLQTSLF